MESTSSTSVSLLGRIARDADDAEAWAAFVDRYGSRIYGWCLNRGLQTVDAEDVAQNVLVKLVRSMETFRYNQQMTFRGWLRRITENAVADFFRERKRVGNGTPVLTSLTLLEEAEAQEELHRRLGEAFDLELLDAAKARVRQRVDEKRWRAWEAIAVERKSGDEVSTSLGMKLPTVYSARYQVQKMIADEVRRLETLPAT